MIDILLKRLYNNVVKSLGVISWLTISNEMLQLNIKSTIVIKHIVYI